MMRFPFVVWPLAVICSALTILYITSNLVGYRSIAIERSAGPTIEVAGGGVLADLFKEEDVTEDSAAAEEIKAEEEPEPEPEKPVKESKQVEPPVEDTKVEDKPVEPPKEELKEVVKKTEPIPDAVIPEETQSIKKPKKEAKKVVEKPVEKPVKKPVKKVRKKKPPKKQVVKKREKVKKKKQKRRKKSIASRRSGKRTVGSQPGGGARGRQSKVAGNASFSNYKGKLVSHLSRYKNYPRKARRDQIKGRVVVRFSINASGRVTSVRLVKRSGSSLLDQAALSSVRRASPFPPIPARMSKSLTITTPIDFIVR